MRSYCGKISFFFFIGFLSLIPVYPQENKQVFDAAGRDPFSPLVSKNGTILIWKEIDLNGLTLKGIIYSQEAPLAIVNDEVLEPGAAIGEYRVLEIEEKRIILKKGNEEFILELEQEEE
ncbi:MAG: hypothetical protein ABIE75_02700 [Candidatus Omnitrophota bacterium]